MNLSLIWSVRRDERRRSLGGEMRAYRSSNLASWMRSPHLANR
jgi:hypothetical protein